MRGFLLLVAAVSFASLSSCGHKPHGQTPRVMKPGVTVQIGQKAPDITLVDLDGKSWQLSELHRKANLEQPGIVVLTFWCSFCNSCRYVEGDLDALAREYSGRVAVFGLDASAGETSEAVSTFLKAEGLTMPVLLDAEGTTADVFGTEVTTTTVVLDAEGVLRYCGQLADGQKTFARDAVEDLLAGREVRVSETPLRG
jgi:peroxiredoxin